MSPFSLERSSAQALFAQALSDVMDGKGSADLLSGSVTNNLRGGRAQRQRSRRAAERPDGSWCAREVGGRPPFALDRLATTGGGRLGTFEVGTTTAEVLGAILVTGVLGGTFAPAAIGIARRAELRAVEETRLLSAEPSSDPG